MLSGGSKVRRCALQMPEHVLGTELKTEVGWLVMVGVVVSRAVVRTKSTCALMTVKIRTAEPASYTTLDELANMA